MPNPFYTFRLEKLYWWFCQLYVQDMQGNYLENQELQPDIELYNTPESQLKGEDLQLEKAVKVMLEAVKK